jgi:ATP-binding cassette subfamily B protein/subfamily B ATP-binding cassette protein MsbA
LKYLLRALRYLKPYWKLAVASGTLVGVMVLISLIAPWPMQIIVDSVLDKQPLHPVLAKMFGSVGAERFSLLILVVVGGLIITLISDLFGVIESYVNTKLDLSMARDFRGDLFLHAQRLSLAFHDQRRSGMLIYAVNSQADAVAGVIIVIPGLLQNILTLIGMFWVTYHLDPTLALLSLVVVPFLYYSVGYYIKHIQQRLMNVKGLEGEVLSVIHESMSMLRVIVAFGRETHEHARFLGSSKRALDARVGITVRQTFFSLVVNMITATGTALVLGFGAYQAMNGKITTGQLLVVLAYIASIYKPLEAISRTVGSLQDQLISLRIAFDLLDTEPEIKDAPHAVAIPRAKGELVFENVCFSYKERPDTLKNVSFSTRQGEIVALVGPTGAGKTTLMSLIPRFYDSVSGRVLLDGKDIREITLKSLRDQVSIVLQEPLLFSGSIAENIRYGRLEATMEEIMEAARGANAHDFIMALPNKYDTEIGERGAQLSGGERQRIAVARAFLKDAPILILDEPTSSIDSKTEAVILDALDRLMVGRTTFMVAHRLSTIRNADKILVLNHGELIEQGPHDELLAKNGLYRQLHDMQTKRTRFKTSQALLGIEDEEQEEQENPA